MCRIVIPCTEAVQLSIKVVKTGSTAVVIPSNNGFHQATRKRIDFVWEKEVRLLYWCHRTTNREKAASEDYRASVDLKELLSEVRASPFNSEKDNKEIQSLIDKAKLNLDLQKSLSN